MFDNKKYSAANIQVTKNFVNRIKTDNYLYNIVAIVPNIIKLPINFLIKLKGKITYNNVIKENVSALKNNLNRLNDDELMTLFTKYRGAAITGRFHLNSIINNLIGQKMRDFAIKKVAIINDELKVKYQTIYGDFKEINGLQEELNKPEITKEQKQSYETALNILFAGKAKEIASIRDLQDEVNEKWLAGGGIHGLEEDLKAATSKMSFVGKRFAKINWKAWKRYA